MPEEMTVPPILGVVVVTYAAANEIAICLETLMAAKDVKLRIVVVDNGSPDDTLDVIRAWADGSLSVSLDVPFETAPAAKPVALGVNSPGHEITVIPKGKNDGFAAGVNVGLAHLFSDTDVERVWVLNPDCAVPPSTPANFAMAPGGFSLMGGRIVFLDDPDKIQIDGGRIQWWSGLTKNLAYAQDPAATPAPDPQSLDFISGASLVVSRAHYEEVGPMQEDYFLYYEEVDWAQRRQSPLAYAEGAVVYHKGGASIGSRTSQRGASSLSLYFLHRARLRFLWRYRKTSILGALLYSVAKAAHLIIIGHAQGAKALLAGSFQAPPPRAVKESLESRR